MTKKIFAVIGIVLASVGAFTGIVFGIMAIQGKFKTPVVYPTELVFENQEELIVDDGEIHSIVLSGSNSSQQHPVNQKTCYIWFVSGEELIELCHEDGTSLEAETNNRYKVECNEKIYYKVRQLTDEQISEQLSNSTTRGKVVLSGRSENNKVQASEKIIWIDREIKNLALDYGVETLNPPTEEEIKDKKLVKQEIAVGVDTRVDIKYLVNPELSRTPVSRENAKDIELYFITDNVSDYVLVNQENIKTGELSKIIKYDAQNNVFYFQSAEMGKYNFKMFCYPTYEIKEKLSNQVTETNMQKLSLEGVLVRDLEISFANTDIIKVDMGIDTVTLNLYGENNYITVNGNSGKTNAIDNNLLVNMYDKQNNKTTLRLNEINIGKTLLAVSDITNPVFKNGNNSLEISNVLETEITFIEEIELSGYKLIECITKNGVNYTCVNGLAVYETETENIKLLKTGSYLDFYSFNNYVYSQFNYSEYFHIGESFGGGTTKTWQIIPTKEIEEDISLELGILVVNSNGGFSFDNFFATVPISVDPVDLTYNVKKSNVSLDVAVEREEIEVEGQQQIKYKSVCSQISFDELINITGGSYNACVLLSDNKLAVEVLENVTYIVSSQAGGEDKTYYLVGYVDENNNYKNAVKIKDNSALIGTNLLMLQLKNGYKQTAEQLLNSLIEVKNQDLSLGTKEISLKEGINFNDYVIKMLTSADVSINVKPNYIVNNQAIIASFGETVVNENGDNYIYNGTTGHSLTISYANLDMFNLICEQFDLISNIATNWNKYFIISNDAVVVSTVTYSNGIITMNFQAEKVSDSTIFSVNLNGLKVLGSLKVKSSEPDEIQFRYQTTQIIDGQPVTETKISSAVKDNTTNRLEFKDISLAIDVAIENDKYVYNYSLMNATNLIKDYGNNFPLNSLISEDENEMGFQVKTYKIEQTVNYGSTNTNIFNINQENFNILKTGEAELTVNIGGVTAYLPVKITSNLIYIDKNNSELIGAQSLEAKGTTANLSTLIKLGENTENVVTKVSENTAILDINSVECVEFGNADLKVFSVVQSENEWSIYDYDINEQSLQGEQTSPILTISRQGKTDWEFIRKNSPYTPLRISFTLSSKFADIKVELSFITDVQIIKNSNWTHLLAGTTVLAYEQNTSVTFNNNAILKVKTASEGSNLVIKVGGSEIGEDYKVPTNVKSVKFEIFADSSSSQSLDSFTLPVRPNIIVLENSINVNSGEQELDLNNKITLKQNSTGTEENPIVYGKDEEYGSNLESVTDKTNVTYTNLTSANALISIVGSTANVGWIAEMGGTKTEKISVAYSGTKVGDVDAVIKNNYSLANIQFKGSNDITMPYIYAKSDINFTINGELTTWYLTKIVAKDDNGNEIFNSETQKLCSVEYDVNNFINKLSLNGISQVYENISLDLTFACIVTNGEDSTTYLLTTSNKLVNRKIIPYVPEEQTVKNLAYSAQDYDFLNENYIIKNTAGIVSPFVNLVKSMKVCGIYEKANEEEIEITNAILSNFDINNGYLQGSANPNSNFKINAISGDKRVVIVKIAITYNNEETFIDEYELTINNAQNISLNYSTNLTINQDDFNYINQLEANTIVFNNQKFEPVLVNTSKETRINFNAVDKYGINRVNVSNNNSSTLSVNFSLSKAGYSKYSGFNNYFNNISIENETEVVFPASSGIQGFVVLKVATPSGNYNHYFLYVYSKNGVDDTNENMTIESDLTTENLTKEDNVKYFVTSVATINENGEYVNSMLNNGSGEELDEINQQDYFQIVTLNAVYVNGGEIYPIRTITVFIQPKSYSSIGYTTEYKHNNPDSTEDFDNGVYYKDLDASQTSIAIEGYTFKILNDETSNAISETGEITKRFIDKDYNFTAVYTKGNLRFVVHYTLKKIDIKRGSGGVAVTEVGEYNEGFNNTISVKDIIGEYSGSVTITVDEGKGEVNGTDITFTQTNVSQEVLVKVTFAKLYETVTSESELTESYTVIVLPGIKTENSYNDVTRLKSIKTETGYSLNYGSTIEFTTNTDKTTHEIGNFTIHTSEKTTLEFDFADNSYCLNKDSISNQIQFVHTASDVQMNMTVKVKSEDSSLFAEFNVPITISQTYKGLVADYSNGADHQVVKSGEKCTTNYLLTTGKIKLLGLKDELFELTGDTEGTKVNITTIGFNNSANPNYLEYQAVNAEKTTTESGVNLTFNTVTVGTKAPLSISNKTGVSLSYMFFITVNGDGVDYTNCEGLYISTGNYVSFLSSASESNHMLIGKSYDSYDTACLYSVKFGVNDPIVYNVKDGESTSGYIKQGNNALIQNGKQYVYQDGDVTYILTFDIDTKNIYIKHIGKDSSIKISAIGASGKDIFKGLTLNFSSKNPVGKFENTRDSVYATNNIILNDKFENIDNSTTFDIQYDKSRVEGETLTEDKYFTVDKTTLITKNVAQNTNIDIVLYVKNGDYYIKQVTYKFTLVVNLQFTTNGDVYSKDGESNVATGTTNFNTDFVLTNLTGETENDQPKNIKNFPLTYNFMSEKKDNSTTKDSSGNVLYKDLIINLYWIQALTTGTSEKMNNGAINFELYDQNLSSVVSVDNAKKTITFNKDYTGDVQLRIFVVTENGNYSAYWNIHVTGIFNAEYINNADKNMLVSSDFKSGTQVKLFNVINDAKSGMLTTVSSFSVKSGSSETQYISGNSTINANISSIVVTEAEFKSALSTKTSIEEAYKSSFTSDGNSEITINNGVLSVNLPNVPHSTASDRQYYVVIYKISYNYLNSGEKTYYLAYRVYNELQISLLISEKTVTDSTLELFYFNESYSNDSVSFVIEYTGPNNYKIKLTKEEELTYSVAYNSENKTYTTQDGSESFVIEKSGTNYTIKHIYKEGETEKTDTYSNLKQIINTYNDTSGQKSMFTANYSSIQEYGSFVDSLA